MSAGKLFSMTDTVYETKRLAKSAVSLYVECFSSLVILCYIDGTGSIDVRSNRPPERTCTVRHVCFTAVAAGSEIKTQ